MELKVFPQVEKVLRKESIEIRAYVQGYIFEGTPGCALPASCISQENEENSRERKEYYN